MDIRRVILCAALSMVLYSLWTAWQTDYPQTTTVSNQTPSLPIPTESAATQALDSPNPTMAAISQLRPRLVHVKTDVLDLTIDLQQDGSVVGAKLLDYPEDVHDKNKPFVLLQDNQGERYIAQSNLFTVEAGQVKPIRFDYMSPKPEYTLSDGEKELTVILLGNRTDGLIVTKILHFTRGSYLIDMKLSIVNTSQELWKGYMNTQLLRTSPQEDKSSVFHVGSFTGASYAMPGKHRYQKITFKDMTKHNLNTDVHGGWIAMQQHYFLTAWIPNEGYQSRFYTRAVDGDYTIGAVSDAITVLPQKAGGIETRLYLGPEVTDTLKAISPGLDLTVDYGWLWFLSALLFSLMKKIYALVGNWGWSIVLVTCLIKLAFYRLSATSYKSMAAMRKLQPKLVALRERYGDDKAKISQATMALYKQEKVNPLGGCLPIIIQIPVFIALYWVLLESVELRQAPFIFWIVDLASSDPYHVLPVIMGITMLIQQKLNPAPADPMQAKIMMFLPVVFTGLFWNFPAGLVLYWIVNNTLSILQQWYITRKFGDDVPPKPTKPKKLVVVK